MESKYRLHVLSGGKPATALEHYILWDYERGELVRNCDWVADGYTETVVSKVMSRMVKGGWVMKLRRGVFEVV